MEKIYISFMIELAKNADRILPLLEKEISLPNIPFPTLGGEMFWNTTVEYNGWRLQQNMITQHARILDPDNIRRAWGTYAGMERAIRRIVGNNIQECGKWAALQK